MNRPGEDLVIPGAPGLDDVLTIPAAELLERFSRSPGPGGQSVNTTDSRVELVFDVATSTALTQAQRDRLLGALAGQLVGSSIVVVASEHRSQHRNRVAARQRLADLLTRGLAPPPPPRRPTRPSRASQQRRLEDKRQRGLTKGLRGRVPPD